MNTLAFSTLGCPGWDIDRILLACPEYGYSSVELRGYLAEMDLPRAAPFTTRARHETARRFTDAGITVCCVASSGVAAQGNVDHVRAHAELASALGAPQVRVFGGRLPEGVARDAGWQTLAENLRAFGDAAAEYGIRIVLETHDDFSTGSLTAELLSLAAHPNVFSLWDLHHPFRQGESPEATLRTLSGTVRHVHVKDSLVGHGYTMFGEGDVPLPAMLDLLLDSGYQGAISLEWEKRWAPQIADPEIAFPQYARALRHYLQNRATR